LGIENTRLDEELLERGNFARRRIERLAKGTPLCWRHDDVYLLRKHLLCGLVGMLQHEVAETGLTEQGSAGEYRFLGRPEPKLHFSGLQGGWLVGFNLAHC
jgi:hypothetical protein